MGVIFKIGVAGTLHDLCVCVLQVRMAFFSPTEFLLQSSYIVFHLISSPSFPYASIFLLAHHPFYLFSFQSIFLHGLFSPIHCLSFHFRKVVRSHTLLFQSHIPRLFSLSCTPAKQVYLLIGLQHCFAR